ncbi:hypothetical protein D3C86_1237430 [compost metagenome]
MWRLSVLADALWREWQCFLCARGRHHILDLAQRVCHGLRAAASGLCRLTGTEIASEDHPRSFEGSCIAQARRLGPAMKLGPGHARFAVVGELLGEAESRGVHELPLDKSHGARKSPREGGQGRP